MRTRQDAQRRGSMTAELGRYVPRQFNPITRERFLRDRRRRYLSQVPSGAPTDAQATMIQSLASLEWSALLSEADGSVQALAAAREHRRLLMRLLSDFEKSVAAPPRAPTTAEILAEIHSPPPRAA